MPTKREYLNAIAETHRNGWVTVGCIPGPGNRSPKGYAKAWNEGTDVYAHNYTLRQAVGDPPEDKPQAAHACRMRGCVNPAHLSWKSNAENMADKHRDGTISRPQGATNGLAKLDDDKVREILRLHATGDYSCRKLASMFDVSKSVISRIVLRQVWTHVAL